jgi:hypothetical protein
VPMFYVWFDDLHSWGKRVLSIGTAGRPDAAVPAGSVTDLARDTSTG